MVRRTSPGPEIEVDLLPSLSKARPWASSGKKVLVIRGAFADALGRFISKRRTRLPQKPRAPEIGAAEH